MNCSIVPPARQTTSVTEEELCAWIGAASPGEQLVYHHGFLAVDCDATASRLPPEARFELKRMAKRAYFAAQCGLVDLIQRRTGPGAFDYMLIVRRHRVAASPTVSTVLTAASDMMGG